MTINCRGELIDLSEPRVMGILNVTPNSFYDGGRYASENEVLKKVEDMLLQGAHFIDVGGYSSKPGSEEVSSEEELRRVVPVIRSIARQFPETKISIDTFRSEVAAAAISEGACLVNDISAGSLDDQMMQTIADLQVPYIMMHMRGTPKTMSGLTAYEDLVKEVVFYFSEKVQEARSLGINDLIIDPGFGFAKTVEQNYELFQKLEVLKMIGLPLLVGISRKSMISRYLGNTAETALNGTTVLNTLALAKGASILRVHDVREAVECVKLYSKIYSS